MEEFCLLGYNAAKSSESQTKCGETCHLHIQDWRLSQVINLHRSGSKLAICSILVDCTVVYPKKNYIFDFCADSLAMLQYLLLDIYAESFNKISF
jgi:hypothetical protein